MDKKKIDLTNSNQHDSQSEDIKLQSFENTRRDFMKMAALSAGALALPNLPVFAGPFNFDNNGHLIPEDKKLSADWIKALYERGKPEVLTAAKGELKHVGMPVGGIACGQLYLGGDGRLWFWHIFKTEYSREKDHGQRFAAMTLGGHYEFPDKVFARETRPVEQGATIRVRTGNKVQQKTLDSTGFKDITFRGEYPIGKVNYKEAGFPVEVNLEAFSPFIPLEAEKSALPVTILSYKVKNTSQTQVNIELAGWLENAVCPYSKDNSIGLRRNTLHADQNRLTIYSTAEPLRVKENDIKKRPDVVFEDFESGSYQNWKVEGKAFGDKPYQAKDLSPNQNLKGFEGKYFINGYNAREEVQNPDDLVGTLTSKTFTIHHNFITFNISGGSHKGKTTVNLIVDKKIVRSETGNNSNTMITKAFDVREFIGKKAKIQIVDQHKGSWGHITIDHIVFTDKSIVDNSLDKQHGYGSMALSLYKPSSDSKSALSLEGDNDPKTIFDHMKSNEAGSSQTAAFDQTQIGALGDTFTLLPGEEKEVVFIVSWFFPHLNQQANESGQLLSLKDIKFLKRHYYNWFKSANQVADYVASDFSYLAESTRLWNKTYYNSTLPYWLLDRSFIPIDCLATNTMNWFDNGRIWGWEGVECCPGTCQHVWQYAQAMARVFPEMEKTLRELTDLGYSFNTKTGVMGHRDETAGHHGLAAAHDGHAGTVMRIYREHKMSADNTFLKQNYSKIKKTIQFLINEDKDKDGILEGRQQNTLDAAWFGPMGWISSLYLGALAVGKEMAMEVGDDSFVKECDELLQKGRKNIVAQLFNGEYFIHKPDPNHPNAINSNDGCHIDQVLGQSFAWQIGVSERVVPERETQSALESIWKYNFAPDAYLYQEQHKPIKGARIYATQGEAGTIMCTWPKGGAEKAVPGMDKRPDKSATWLGPGGYFDEAMNGFEYQIATHMIYEGMLEKGLATARAVHDRYNAIKRNPYNEIECSDHYSRSMASYGVLLAICGFDYHGPKGHLNFDPKLNPENFKAPFILAEGWGTFSQQRAGEKQTAVIEISHGKAMLSKITLHSKGSRKSSVALKINGKEIASQLGGNGEEYQISWEGTLLKSRDQIEITIV
ncbi:GH116 family glycosyl hydrolase [Fulvivirgaceae bacterium BMA10]|uniref:GH116 family glycosyl hydrolase n=1 Tax=Splendidivirga corallicola TaxID=3051826 RepID=A0ABT8KUA2_9BACT|nr:GH116 family glycosyl hydrolase [Fulvivirgaceae bacterium BMA10]